MMSSDLRMRWISLSVGQRLLGRIHRLYILIIILIDLLHIQRQQCQKDLFYSFFLPQTRLSMVE